MVIIARTDKNTAALLVPRERYFLYQNLRLQLELSRMALLIRDEDQYRILREGKYAVAGRVFRYR